MAALAAKKAAEAGEVERKKNASTHGQMNATPGSSSTRAVTEGQKLVAEASANKPSLSLEHSLFGFGCCH